MEHARLKTSSGSCSDKLRVEVTKRWFLLLQWERFGVMRVRGFSGRFSQVDCREALMAWLIFFGLVFRVPMRLEAEGLNAGVTACKLRSEEPNIPDC